MKTGYVIQAFEKAGAKLVKYHGEVMVFTLREDAERYAADLERTMRKFASNRSQPSYTVREAGGAQ